MSFDYTGSFSGSFFGDVTASNGLISSSAQVTDSLPVGVISSSAQTVANLPSGVVSSSAQSVTNLPSGVISSSNQISYPEIVNKPLTISAFQKNSIVANNRFREVTFPNISSSVSTRLTDLENATDGTGSDSQTLTFDSSTNALSISDGNSVDLSSLSGGGGDGTGMALTASDEGSELSKNVRSIDFVGNAVTATNSGNALTVTVNTSSATSIPDGTISSSAQVIASLPDGTVSGSGQIDYNSISNVPSGILSSSTQIASDVSGSLSATAISNLGTGIVSQSGGIVDLTGVKIQYSNVYSNIGDLPSASDYHGMFAHVHATGKGYYAHGGNWIELANADGNISSSAQIASDISGSLSATAIAALGAGILSGSVSNTDGAISSSTQIAELGADIISGSFDGNRIVSNTDLPSGIYNVNFGTSGSVSNFIEKVFFPNTAPSISSSFFRLEEFEASGSVVGTISATDAEGQTITFRTASSYTDDKFRIHSGSGQITINVDTTASLNVTNTPLSVKNPASSSHVFPVETEDTFGGVSSADIYIHINPNTAPKWRQTSAGGSVITTFTHSLNENSVSGSAKVKVYFTDDESDTITIGTGSLSADFSSRFSLDIDSNFVQLNQTTASLDYESITQFEFVLTASDQHYEDGDDTDSIAYLPFQVAVVDNIGPAVNDQTVGSINENSGNGATVGTVTATDDEGDTIVFSNFTLTEANLDGGSNITSSLASDGGTLINPARDPFQISANTGVVTRKSGVFLNSDVANRYFYRVTVNDAFNDRNDTGIIRINIDDDSASTITDNWTNPYIIESALDGDSVRVNSNGRTGTIAQWSSAVSQRWEVTSENDLIEVTSLTGSTTQLRVKNDISASANSFDGDDRISVALTASEHGFETTKQFIDVDVRVAINNAPDITFTNTTNNLNTNGARSGSTLTTIGFSDTESDTVDHDTFTFTDPSGQLNSVRSGNTYLIQASENLSGSTNYGFTASIQDTHRFRTNTENHQVTIAQSTVGVLGGDTTSYIIESAVSGAVLRDATGYNNGNASQLTVSYSPSYNSQAVQSFTSSNSAFEIDSSGNITLDIDISGSSTGSGDTISSDITFRDQFDNIGSGSLTVNVFANQAPSATFSDVTANHTASVAINTNLVNVTISDTESDTPFSASLSGTGATSLKLVPQNVNSSSYQIQNVNEVSSGPVTYNYNVQISDNFGKTQDYNGRSIVIAAEPVIVYGYGWDGGSAISQAAAIASLGDTGADEVGIESGSVIAMFQSGAIGLTSFANSAGPAGTVTLYNSASLATMSDSNTSGLSTLGYFNFSSTSQRLIVIFASSSIQGGKPASMYDGVPPDSSTTPNEYYVYAKDAAIPGTIGTGVYYFDTESPVNGVSRWGMIFAEGENTNNSRYFLMPDSASAP